MDLDCDLSNHMDDGAIHKGWAGDGMRWKGNGEFSLPTVSLRCLWDP